MSLVNFAVTSPYRDNRLMQFVEETAGSYGIFPTNPTMNDFSICKRTRTTYNTLKETYRKLGNRNVYKYIKTGRERTWTMDWSPVDTQMIRYITENGNSAGTLTGTVDKTLSFWNSIRRAVGSQTLTEHHVTRTGSKGDSITVSTTSRALVECSADMISRDVPKPTTSSPLGAGVAATPTTSTPWSHLTGGTSKVTLGGVIYPFKRASFTVNNNLDIGDPDGSEFTEWLEPMDKNVTFEVDVIIGKDLSLEDDVETLADLGSASIVLNSTGPKTATFVSPIVCTGYEIDRITEAKSADVYTFNFEAADVSVTA